MIDIDRLLKIKRAIKFKNKGTENLDSNLKICKDIIIIWTELR